MQCKITATPWAGDFKSVAGACHRNTLDPWNFKMHPISRSICVLLLWIVCDCFFLKTSLAYFFVIESMRFAETARFIALPSQTKVAVCQEMTMNYGFRTRVRLALLEIVNTPRWFS